MADVQITVRGSSESAQPPERATVQLAVAMEGATKDAVFGAASQTASVIAAQIAPMFDRERGPVTWWSSDQVRTWSHRPWNKDGKQLPAVHHAAVQFSVKFADFDALGRWLGAVAPQGGVTVSGIEWALTEARRVELTEQVRAAAVHDARDKALSYARSLGLGEIRAVAVADVGMLGDHVNASSGASPGGVMARAAGLPAGAQEPGLSFTPQDVTIAAAVDARFLA